jgi:tRNA(fMet)-specific endonuclease VapC
MRYLLDTNHVSYIAKGTSMSARSRFIQQYALDQVFISAITEGEVRYGLAKKPEATSLRRVLEEFLEKVEILPWGHDEAAAYAALWARLETSGKTLEPMDMLIAAQAVTRQLTLVSRDKAFRHIVPADAIEDWATDLM